MEKNPQRGISSRRISKFEGKSFEMIESEGQKKEEEKSKKNLRSIWATIMQTNINFIENLRKKRYSKMDRKAI